MFARMKSLSKMTTAEEEEEEEIVQTKVIAQAEVRKNWESWLPSINTELEAMLEIKSAFMKITKEELGRDHEAGKGKRKEG